jgi:regulator of cell morphogenesis and NO signaling
MSLSEPIRLPSTRQPLAECSLGEIAVTLPGATAVFRRHHLDFCCGGNVVLREAAAKKGISPDTVVTDLVALAPRAAPEVPQSTGLLIGHILTNYHESHRRGLRELIRLARRVEAVHREHAEAPAGLARILVDLQLDLEMHMAKEEVILFPMLMQADGDPMAFQSIACLRQEHDELGDQLRKIEALTRDCTPPEGACTTWQALYVGLRKLVDDLMEHIHLENNVLFPRFEGAAKAGAGD